MGITEVGYMKRDIDFLKVNCRLVNVNLILID